jgi:hypothetical protein
MDTFLAEYYGTGKTAEATTDDETKLAESAQFELFAKVAAAEGIDLNSLTDEQIEKLYTDTFSKTAGENPFAKKDGDDGEKKEEKKDDDKDDEKKAAAAELEEKKAGAEKLAEADFLGRVMAHAYVQELNKIASAQADGESEEAKEASGTSASSALAKRTFGDAVRGVAHNAKETAKGVGKSISDTVKGKGVEKAKSLHSKAVERAGAARKNSGASGMSDIKDAIEKKTGRNVVKEHAKRVGTVAAPVAALAGGAAAASSRKKEASAIDELAAVEAIVKAASAGWDSEECAQLMSDLLEAGPSEEGSKVASAADVDQAVDIRSSELLELAGYPVSWE